MPDEAARYNESQMAVILKRAAEVQAARESGTLSLAEIQAIAREAGIDPAVVAEVASTLPTSSATAPSPARRRASAEPQVAEFTLPRRASPEQLGSLLEAVRRAAAAAGTSREVLGGVEWQVGSDREVVDLRVSITPSAQGTHVRVSQDSSGAVGLGVIVAVAPALVGSIAAIGNLGLTMGGAVAAVIGGACIGGVALWRRYLARQGAEATARIAEAIQKEAARHDAG